MPARTTNLTMFGRISVLLFGARLSVLAQSTSSTTLSRVEFPPGPTFSGSPSSCNNWYLVQAGDSCSSVEAKFGISHAQFIKLNPAVSDDCLTNFWVGEAYCVGLGRITGTPPSSTIPSTGTSRGTTITSSLPLTSAPPYSTRFPISNWTISAPSVDTARPPTKTQAGQPSYCNDWHLVGPGETCANIISQHNTWMSPEDFYAWNPTVGTDCSGLYLYWWVCVSIQPQTSPSVAWATPTGNGTLVIPPYVTWTPAPLPPANTSFSPTPTQGALAKGCTAFYQTKSGDTCRVILARFGFITESQFFSWNTYLSNNCDGLWAGYYYCVGVFSPSNLPMPPTVTAQPAPVQSGITTNCQAWYQMTTTDTCDSIATMFGTFSKSDFIAWNPAVGSDCSGLTQLTYYCVGIPGTPTTRTSGLPPPTTIPDRPTQSGIASTCSKFWLVSTSDSCGTITAANAISQADFLSWNPAVGTTGCTNLLPDYYVCVELGGPSSSPTISGSVLPSTSGGSSSSASKAQSSTSVTNTSKISSGVATPTSTPSPVQPGMVSGCHRFYYVESGDGCWAIANSAKIDLNLFYTWNPAVKTDCTLLLAGYYVCIGIEGPMTTITSGPPMPT